MRQKTVFVILSWLLAPAFFLGQALAQAPAAEPTACIPTAEQAAQLFGARGLGAAGRVQQGRGPAAQPVPRNLTIAAIPGVVAAGGKWTKVWQEAGNSADGMIPDKDGSVLVAQEDYDTVLKIDANGEASVAVADAKGVGALSMDRQGRLYGAHRTERPGSTKPDKESIVNAITMLSARTHDDRRQVGRRHDVDGSAKRSRRGQLWRRVFHDGLPLLCQPEGGHRGGG